MPIDFALVAVRFGDQVASEARRVLLVERALESSKVLSKRRDAARAVEQATRMFPIVLFYEGAITMTIAPAQRGLLAVTSPPPSVCDGLARGGMSFVASMARAVEPFKATGSEHVISSFFAIAELALREIEMSVRRFQKPEWAPEDKPAGSPHETIFGLSTSAGDLLGIAGLAFRVLDEASRKGGEIEKLTAQLKGARTIFADAGRASTPPPAAALTIEAPPLTLVDQLESGARALTAGMLIVAFLPELVGVLLEAVVDRVRSLLLGELRLLESSMLDFRDEILRKPIDAILEWADDALNMVVAIQSIVGANISFLLLFWRSLGGSFLTGVTSFATGIVTFLGALLDILRALPAALDALVSFDLRQLVEGCIKHTGAELALDPISLADTLDKDARNVNFRLARRLSKKVDKLARGALPLPLWIYVLPYVPRLRRLIDALFPGWSSGGSLAIPVLEDPPPFPDPRRMPDIFQTLFSGAHGKDVLAQIDVLAANLDVAIGENLRQARDRLDASARAYGQVSHMVARKRDAAELRRIATGATDLAQGIFGNEVAGQREAIKHRDDPVNAPATAVARAFESWLATGGFVLVGELIPAYVDGLARHWREQAEHDATAPVSPTSPHILRRRATLGRVQVPRMRMHAPPGRELDGGLADEVVQRFGFAVEDAYRAGSRRLSELAAVPGG